MDYGGHRTVIRDEEAIRDVEASPRWPISQSFPLHCDSCLPGGRVHSTHSSRPRHDPESYAHLLEGRNGPVEKAALPFAIPGEEGAQIPKMVTTRGAGGRVDD